MSNKLMYMPNDDTQNWYNNYNYWLKRLDTKLIEPTNQNSLEFPKFFSHCISQRCNKTLGTSCIVPSLSVEYCLAVNMLSNGNDNINLSLNDSN